MLARTYFAPVYFGSRYFAGQDPSGYFAHTYFGSRYFAPRYFAPQEAAGGYFPHRHFAERYFPGRYFCPAVPFGSLISFSAVTRPTVRFAATSRELDWTVRCRTHVEFAGTSHHLGGFAVISGPSVSFAASGPPKRGEFEIIERPYVQFVPTIGKAQECVSGDGYVNPYLVNAVY